MSSNQPILAWITRFNFLLAILDSFCWLVNTTSTYNVLLQGWWMDGSNVHTVECEKHVIYSYVTTKVRMYSF